MTAYPLALGCVLSRHRQLGVHAVINARAGRQDLNQLSIEDVEMRRDAERVRARVKHRVRVYQFNSRHFRRRAEMVRLLSDPRED